MENGNTTKLFTILESNKKNNILIMGMNGSLFSDAVIIPSTLPSEKLGIGISDSGNYIYPNWIKEIESKKSAENILIIIDSLDKVSTDEQNKFYGLLKYKGINGYKLPENSQLICTSKSKDKSKINYCVRITKVYE